MTASLKIATVFCGVFMFGVLFCACFGARRVMWYVQLILPESGCSFSLFLDKGSEHSGYGTHRGKKKKGFALSYKSVSGSSYIHLVQLTTEAPKCPKCR